MIVLLGNAATRMNPVPRVAVIPPSVPMLDSRPTTRPVRRTSPSWSLTTSGVTAESSAAGTTTASAVSSSTPPVAAPRSASPAYRTTGRVMAVAIPASSSAGPSSRRGSRRSATRPPIQVP